MSKRCNECISLVTNPEYPDVNTFSARCKQLIYDRQLCVREILDPLLKFRIHLRFHPRHILTRLTDSLTCSRQTILHRQVKHKYRVATPETQRKSAQIISINYPLLSIHNLMQRLIKLLPADISLIRTMPYHIQIMKRQMQLPGEFPCKRALPCPGTTNHYYSLHISYVSVYQVFVKGVEHCREVAFASVGENHYDILTLVLLSLGYRQGCR